MSSGRGRGFALVVVLFAVGVATSALLLLQASAFRQAISGREAVGRLRAEWAARAGLEATIARLAAVTEAADTSFAYAAVDEMTGVSRGNIFRGWDVTGGVAVAEWSIEHFDGERLFEGPADAHSKVNISKMTREDLLELPGMTEDVAAAVIDWVDADDLVTEFGAEGGYYSRREPPVEPRNGRMRSIEELELVAGVDSELVRGEDWNLNGRLDANEDDGDASWPPDNSDGVLDAGWSGIVTTESLDQGLAESGDERVYLPAATPAELSARVDGLENAQARAMVSAAANAEDGEGLEIFLGADLRALAFATGSSAMLSLGRSGL